MLRVREMERIDAQTGRSTIFRDAYVAANQECRAILRAITERAEVFRPVETDNGPRIRVDLACGCFWLVYV